MDNSSQTVSVPEAIGIAMDHHHAGRLPQAEAIYRQVLQVEPNNHRAVHLLGILAHQVGKNDAAIEFIGRALALRQDYAEGYNDLAQVFKAQGKLNEAIACYQKVVSLKPDYAEAYKNLGNLFFGQKKLDDAVTLYQKALAVKPDYDAPYNNLGAIFYVQGKVDQAVACYRKALALQQTLSSGTLFSLGIALYAQGNLREAMDCLEKALPLKADTWVGDSAACLAVFHYLQGDLEEALRLAVHAGSASINGDNKLHSYFDYLKALSSWREENAGAIEHNGNDGIVHVIGESHALSPHHVCVPYQGKYLRCQARWILGCKQWHLGNQENNRYKYQFEAIVKSLPPQAAVLLNFGEIDCRINEGMIAAWQKGQGKTLEDVAAATVDGYLQYVSSITGSLGLKIIISGVPAVNIPLDHLPREAVERFIHLVRLFNTLLKTKALAAKMDFLDVFALTDAGNGISNKLWHLDNNHLRPDAIIEAFRKHYFSAV